MAEAEEAARSRGQPSGTRRRRVVLIDSGVDPQHPGVRGRIEVASAWRIDGDGTACAEDRARDRLGHGTAVAAAIAGGDTAIGLVAIRVFDHEPVCPAAVLVGALRHALSFAPAIVNVSLGLVDASPEDAAAIAAVVRDLCASGCRVVAPFAAHGRPCLPGGLPPVDAVVDDPNVPWDRPRRVAGPPRPHWRAHPAPPPGIPGLPPAAVRGASLAAGHVTRVLCAALLPSPPPGP